MRKKDKRKLLFIISLSFLFFLISLLAIKGVSSLKKSSVESAGTSVAAVKRGTLYFVIDDVGYNIQQLEPFLKFPAPLTISVLPGLAYTVEAADLARRAGKEVILHLPMEPLNGEDPGPGAIYANMGENEIDRVLNEHMRELPFVKGVNNHMGSLVTADRRVMFAVLSFLKREKLYFLDSLTTSRSVAGEIAGELQLPFIERSVFLDNQREKQAIKEAIEQGLTIAEKKGFAVMIGHVWSNELAELLMELYPGFIEEGYSLEQLSAFLLNKESDENTRN